MVAILGILGGVVIAVISTIGAIVVARRSTSGSAEKSDAKTLWEQAKAMREELRQQVVDCQTVVEKLQREADIRHDQMVRMADELIEAKHKLTEQETQINMLRHLLTETRQTAATLDAKLHSLSDTSTTVTSDVAALKQELQLIQGGHG